MLTFGRGEADQAAGKFSLVNSIDGRAHKVRSFHCQEYNQSLMKKGYFGIAFALSLVAAQSDSPLESFSIQQRLERELWTCSNLDCVQCSNLGDRRFCSASGQDPYCCSKTDNRPICSQSYRNCTDQFTGASYMTYIVCPYSDSMCGSNPNPQSSSDPEYDGRFGSNMFIARTANVSFDSLNSQVTVGTGFSFVQDKYCVYVLQKAKNKMSIYLNITQMWGSDAYVMKGGPTFGSTKTQTTYISGPQNLKFTNISQNEYIYIIAKGKQANAGFQFNVSGFGDILPPPSNNTNSTGTVLVAGEDNTNLIIIIGAAIGGLAVIGVTGGLIYYFVKRNKLRVQKQALQQQDRIKLIKPKQAQTKKQIKEESEEEEYEDEDEEEEKAPPPKPPKTHLPVHPAPFTDIAKVPPPKPMQKKPSGPPPGQVPSIQKPVPAQTQAQPKPKASAPQTKLPQIGKPTQEAPSAGGLFPNSLPPIAGPGAVQSFNAPAPEDDPMTQTAKSGKSSKSKKGGKKKKKATMRETQKDSKPTKGYSEMADEEED